MNCEPIVSGKEDVSFLPRDRLRISFKAIEFASDCQWTPRLRASQSCALLPWVLFCYFSTVSKTDSLEYFWGFTFSAEFCYWYNLLETGEFVSYNIAIIMLVISRQVFLALLASARAIWSNLLDYYSLICAPLSPGTIPNIFSFILV